MMRIRYLSGQLGTWILTVILVIGLPVSASAGERVPGAGWMRYAHVEQAGFDADKLEAARKTWEGIPSAAFLIVADGAVVAAWGDVDRRFMCHSVRKSFLSALYGIYWDRGEIKLNKTMADLGIDDFPDPLLETERQARILDLLKARSGVFHPAAYAGRTDSRPRGSEGPGRYFAYNNWDFNTLATILEQETGDKVFEAFDEYFGQPLDMEDWRISDGYYHYERDKSRYPAYPFRISARDAARFGLLFAREGMWGDARILSEHWVRRSSALYSIDTDIVGYGFMWWVYREPRFAKHGMYAASGVGNQKIAVLPKSDMVIVNRANTYLGQGTPSAQLLDLIEQVLEARTGTPVANPELAPLETEPDPKITKVPRSQLTEFAGEWDYPPAPLGLPKIATVSIQAADTHLVGYVPFAGTFKIYLQPDGSLHEEDSYRRYLPIRDESGAFAGIADAGAMVRAALASAAEGHNDRARDLMAEVEDDGTHMVDVGRAVLDLLDGQATTAEQKIKELTGKTRPTAIENMVNNFGYGLLQSKKPEQALKIFALNTRVFPEAWNTWDSLAEAHMILGDDAEAIRFYEKSIALNEDNTNAKERIAKIKQKQGK
jgi:CubicO group peptidase (beta-lactamase class C family)